MAWAKWHSAKWPGETSMFGGSVVLQIPWVNRQRVRNRHPLGGSIGLGNSPLMGISTYSWAGSGMGTAERCARGEGCVGCAMTSSVGAVSTIRPRYLTAIRSYLESATARYWAMNAYGI